MPRRPPNPTLFPYTTLFRSARRPASAGPTARRNVDSPAADRSNVRRRPAGRRWHSRIVDRKSTRLNSSHLGISYAVFCLKKKKVLLGNKKVMGPGADRGVLF